MRRTVVFEGWYDQAAPGWEFSLPVYMVKPCLMYTDDAGSGPDGVDGLIEDYLISRWMKTDANGKAIGTEEDLDHGMDEDDDTTYTTAHGCRVQFALAKKGKARQGVLYWRRVVEWDDEDENYMKVLEDSEAA